MRETFTTQLKELNSTLSMMGSMCEDCITCSTQALLTGANELADKAIELEKDIDIKEREIQNLCMKLLLQQQPVAHDLRTISSALKMITDMERIGDQGSDIAELLQHLNSDDEGRTEPSQLPRINNVHIAAMADATIRMVTGSVDSFVRQDASLAREVADMDDEVDALFIKVKSDILDMITSGDKHDRAFGEQAINTLMIAKYLERIGDHAVNITEWVRFSLGE
jgi:phosphate transport system protein